MCGIAGFLSPLTVLDGNDVAIEHMRKALSHRGPDSSGVWTAPNGRAQLAHTRLSILDLSPAGHQPMVCRDERAAIVFNGEIYNFRELRAELEAEGEVFTSQTDTEVLLLGCRRHGAGFAARLRGMFAFCYWDAVENKALVARDGFGIKPLYYIIKDSCLIFSSELRGLMASGVVVPALNSSAVAKYFATGSMSSGATLLKEVQALPEGSILEFSAAGTKITAFWHVDFPTPQVRNQHEGAALARASLESSMKAHLVSDVPVGVFLSGGIDSTAILAMLRNQNPHGQVKTFSISVDDAQLDEAAAAANTATRFGTVHHELKLDAELVAGTFAEYLNAMDVPSMDGYNTWMVSRFASQHGMKVVLSGLGGDELMAGYSTFRRVPKLRDLGRKFAWLGPLTWIAAKFVGRFACTSKWKRIGGFLQGKPTLERAYAATRGVFTQAEAEKLAKHFSGSVPDALPAAQTLPANERDAVSMLELTHYMRNQLLRDSDVMSMAHGLELRVPFVDTALFDSLATIDPSIRLAQGKKLLLAAVPEVPEEIANAPKRGFLFPYEKWLATGFGDQFRQATAKLPVPANEWYQKWTVFVFCEWCMRMGVSFGG